MKLENLFIEDIKFGEGESCFGAPMDKDLVLSLKLKDVDDEVRYLVLTEYQSFVEFYFSDEDNYEKWINKCGGNTAQLEKLSENTYIAKIGKLVLPKESETYYEGIYKNKLEDTIEGRLIRYMGLLMFCPYEKLNDYISLGKGKYLNEIEFPISDDELSLLS